MKTLGTTTTYDGTEHAYLRGHKVRIVAVLKNALRADGESQGSCRLNIYAVRFVGSETTKPRSGLSVTIRIGSQLRIPPDQRSGCLARASS